MQFRTVVSLSLFPVILGSTGACARATTSRTAMQVGTLSDTARRALAARMIERTRPGAEHRALSDLAGDWTIQTMFRSSVRGTDPVRGPEGTARNTVALDGRFLISETREFWGSSEVQGLSRYGFDRRVNQYTLSRCDTWGTYCVDATSRGDTARGAASIQAGIVMDGATQDPVANDGERYRFVLSIASRDMYRVAIEFRQSDGTYFTMVESTYRRR